MLGAVGKSCSRGLDRRVSIWATSSIDRHCWHVLAAAIGSSHGSFPAHAFSSWTKLESATGRARKRRRRITQLQRQERIVDSPRGKKQADQVVEAPRSHPQNKPWLVLFPNPELDQDGVDQGPAKLKKSLREVFRDLGKAWNLYLTTWEGTILRAPRKETDTMKQEMAGPEGPSKGEEIRSNVARNLEVAQREGTDMIEQAKEQTGIRNQEDLKAFASDTMKLATECLKEFMAGYREGRDNEVDKMLHEYFQEQQGKSQSSDKEEEDSKPKRRRKPKRRILRD